MKVKVSNEIIVEDYTPNVEKFCLNNLVIDNPDYYMAEKMGRYLGNIEKEIYLFEKRGNALVLPFGTIKDLWKILDNPDFIVDFPSLMPLKMTGNINLYDYQEKALKMIYSGKNGILEAPCGSGKTQIGLALIKKLGLKALWLTHTKDLLNQSLNRAKEYFKGDFGVITNGKVNIGEDITFATVQTMQKLDLQKYAKEWNVIIVDECHRVAGSPTKVMQFYKVLSNLKARHKYGLSATLHRSDNLIKTTYAVLGDIIYSIPEKEVADKIVKAEHRCVYTGLEESFEYLDTDGTLDYGALMEYVVRNKDRNKLIVEYLKSEPDKYHLILSSRVKHLEELQKLANSCNITSTEIVNAKVTDKKRLEIFNRMRSGELHYLFATYPLAKEGLDIPILDRLHFASPQKDKVVVKQSAGRIERKFGKTKKEPIIYDYVDEKIGYCLMMYKKRKNILKRRN